MIRLLYAKTVSDEEMNTHEFLTSVSLILLVMGVLAVVELALPMVTHRPALHVLSAQRA